MPSLTPGLFSRSTSSVPKVILGALTLLTGYWIATAPLKAWILLSAIAMLALLQIQPVYWIVAAICAAVLSRGAVALGAPHFLNFIHFPLVLGAVLVSTWQGRSTRTVELLGAGLLSFLAINLLSWILNGGEPLRPILNWLVLAQPFLVVYALLKAPPPPRFASKIWTLLVALGFVQVVLGVFEWPRDHGNPDLVQGSFIGSGTGAHVAGSVVLLGVLIVVAKASTAGELRKRAMLLLMAAPLLGLSVIADAKQVIFCFMPGLLLAILSSARLRVRQLFVPIGFATALFYIAFLLYPPLQIIANQGLVSEGLAGKVAGLTTIASYLSRSPAGWLLGLGPGNTVSRVALLTPDAELDPGSSVAMLGLKTAPVTRQILLLSQSNYIWNSSSVWSPLCSWYGLLGDLGLVGCACYLALARLLWKQCSGATSWQSAVAKGSLLMAAALGGVFDWLEEPAFILLVATIAGLAVAERQRQKTAQQMTPASAASVASASRTLSSTFS